MSAADIEVNIWHFNFRFLSFLHYLGIGGVEEGGGQRLALKKIFHEKNMEASIANQVTLIMLTSWLC